MAVIRASAAERFEFGPGLLLEVGGDRATLVHFRREYGPTHTATHADVHVRVCFTGERAAKDAAVIRGGHKTVGWTVGLSAPDARPLVATVSLRGRPRGFARSLVQGYFLEPLLAVAAAREGCVVLPAAAFAENGAALLVLGRSGVGKSTLTARAAAAGRRVLGDDQVVVDESGGCWPFPRRMRFYSDLQATAPLAYGRLSASQRASLRLRRIVERATRGYVAPSLPVPRCQLGAVQQNVPFPVGRLLVIERDRGSPEFESGRLEGSSAVRAAEAVILEQRLRLAAAGGKWIAELEQTRRRELAILERALSGTEAKRLAVPEGWEPARAVEALWQRLAPDGGDRNSPTGQNRTRAGSPAGSPNPP
jgi:hypothetical protein